MISIYLAMLDTPAEQDRFKQAYNRYKDMMYRVAYAILRNEMLAEDAVQESFFKVCGNFSRIGDVLCSETQNFFVILVRNTALDILRKERKEADTSENLDYVPDTSLGADISDSVVSKENYGRILKLLGELPMIYKDTMKLKFLLGCTNDEIAGFMNVTKKNVEMRLYRGKALLLELMKEGERRE